MVETTVAKNWIFNTLTNDATIQSYVGDKVFDSFVPLDATFPCIVYLLYFAGEDVRSVGSYRIYSEMNYYIKCIDKNSNYATARLVADRIDALLDRGHFQDTSSEVISCIRLRPLEYPEVLPEVQYRHIGGLYQIRVHA